MAKPSWLNDRIADDPIDRGQQNDPEDTDENPTVATSIATASPDTASTDSPKPAAGQLPLPEIWGTRDEWKSKTDQVIDPETGIWTGRTRQIFLRTSECPRICRFRILSTTSTTYRRS